MVLAVLARAGDNCYRKFVIGLLANCVRSSLSQRVELSLGVPEYPNKRPGWNEGLSLSWGRQAGSKLQEHSWLVAWFSSPTLFNFLFIYITATVPPPHPFSRSTPCPLHLPTPIHSSKWISPPVGSPPSLKHSWVRTKPQPYPPCIKAEQGIPP